MLLVKRSLAVVLILAIAYIVVTAIGLASCVRPEAGLEPDLTGRRVAILVGEGVEAALANDAVEYFTDRGASVTVLGLAAGRVTGDRSFIRADKAVSDASVDDYDCLMIPGGHHYRVLNESPAALDFISAFHATGKLTAGMCGGVYVLVETTAVDGRRLASVGGLDPQLIRRAGATPGDHDDLFVLDGNLFTASDRAYPTEFVKQTAEHLAQMGG